MTDEGELKAQFYKSIKFRLDKCLHPSMTCTNKAIRAHSVQRATALTLVAEDGHVSELKPKIEKDLPTCNFHKVCINSASTFTGMCGPHDTEMFLPIDTAPLDIKNAAQMFLIAYRSVTRELHVVMESAVKMQDNLNFQIKAGIVPENAYSPIMMTATAFMYKAWLVYRYRAKFYDLKLAQGRFHDVLHSTFYIKGQVPVLASSSFFPIDDAVDHRNDVRIALNVIPLSNEETFVMFSYARAQSAAARKRIASIMLKPSSERPIALSALVLDTTENFFMRPSHVANWSDEKRSSIERAFFSTVVEGAHLKAGADLMLF